MGWGRGRRGVFRRRRGVLWALSVAPRWRGWVVVCDVSYSRKLDLVQHQSWRCHKWCRILGLRDTRVCLPVPRGLLLHSYGRTTSFVVHRRVLLPAGDVELPCKRVPRGVLLPCRFVAGHSEPDAVGLVQPRGRVRAYAVRACSSRELQLCAHVARDVDVDVQCDVFWSSSGACVQHLLGGVFWHPCELHLVRSARSAGVWQRRIRDGQHVAVHVHPGLRHVVVGHDGQSVCAHVRRCDWRVLGLSVFVRPMWRQWLLLPRQQRRRQVSLPCRSLGKSLCLHVVVSWL